MFNERIKQWLDRAKMLGLAVVVLLVAGIATTPLTDRIWPRIRAVQPELNLVDLEDALGQGILIGAFGGFRPLLADIVWIMGNADWERCDRPKVEAMIKLANTLDPTNPFFWRNGARILAYDIPVWRLREEQLDVDDRTGERATAIRQEQAARANALLDKVIARDPDNAWPFIEKAQIYNAVLRDTPNAAENFRLAAERPGAPYFAARIYADKLAQMGQPREAYAYLRKLYDELPIDDKFAARDIVYDRIRALEDELDLPKDERYKGEAPPPANTVDFDTKRPRAADAPADPHAGHSH